MPNSIVEGFFNSAELNPSKTALIFKNEEIDYRQVAINVRKVAGFLESKGVVAGDRVIFYGQKHPLFAYTYLAIHALNAVAVPVDVKLPEDGYHKIVEQVEPALILHKIQNRQNIKQFDFNEALLDGDEAKIKRIPSSDEIADILFTTGTTGGGKGVQLTHRNILAGAINSNQFIGNIGDDTEIIPLPVHHAFGLRRLRTNLFLGATAVLIDGFMFPKLFFEAIEKFGANGICMVPAGFEVVKKLMKDRYIEHFKKLKYIEFGSSPMALETKYELIGHLPDTRICMHYGLTEVAANIFIEFNESQQKLSSLGTSSPNVEVNILGSNEVFCNDGDVGELVVRGEIRTPGYLNNDELTEKTAFNEWFRTGDLGFKDSDGYIHLRGRVDDVINVGGKKVFPAEIENVLESHDLVKESAVIASRSESSITGEEIVAFVVIKQGAVFNRTELIQFLREHLESYKVPSMIKEIGSIPKTSSGKKQRDRLKGSSAN